MANDEDLARLRQGIAVWNAWPTQNRERLVDFREAKLYEANLVDGDLRQATLVDSRLDGSNLTGAKL